MDYLVGRELRFPSKDRPPVSTFVRCSILNCLELLGGCECLRLQKRGRLMRCSRQSSVSGQSRLSRTPVCPSVRLPQQLLKVLDEEWLVGRGSSRRDLCYFLYFHTAWLTHVGIGLVAGWLAVSPSLPTAFGALFNERKGSMDAVRRNLCKCKCTSRIRGYPLRSAGRAV